LRRIDYDIIFTIGTYSNLLASFVADPAKVIMSEHMNMSLRTQAARFGWVMRRLMRWRYPKSLIVAAARGITADLEENFGAARTRVIPNGMDADRIRALAEEDPGPLPTAEPYNIAVGRLAPQKDYPTLLLAHAEARQRGMPDHLLIAGDGELRGQLQDLATSLHIADSIHFLGYRPNPYPLMKRARCLILSSVFEGFAYVPLEAMALDLPVICTDCPSGPAEILADGRFGLLARPGDVNALASAMLKLSADPQTRQYYSRQSRLRAGELTIERMARQYRDLFFQEANRLPR
jgi:glycosyltransferase involved in cell wall biosynthesis